MGFRGDGVRLSSDEGVAGVRLRRRKGIFQHLLCLYLCRTCRKQKHDSKTRLL